MVPVIFLVVVLVLAYFFRNAFRKRKWKLPEGEMPKERRAALMEHVAFYRKLDKEQQRYFEYEVEEFLLNYKITPISTTITDVEKVLIAASGVIPIFSFPDWKYVNLTEILVYPNTFNLDFDTKGEARDVLGVVGTGALSGKMILSKKAIINGFASDRDGHNTAIHEFVHLIDGADGEIDGLPEVLLEQPYTLPWLELIREEILKIQQDQSELRDYGATNFSEFFAVASEYFFEKPKELQQKHPELFYLLERMFKAGEA